MPKVIQVRNFDAINEDEWRVLSAVETGMRNHEFVPLDILHSYSGIKHGGKNFIKIIRNSLIPRRLIAYERAGYRLTNLGYDFLALHKLIKSGVVFDLSNFQMFGTGKESDLYVCKSGEDSQNQHGIDKNFPIVLKFHRLGRTSFKQVKNKREYKTGNNCSWIYMNRISATREYLTMKELYEAKLPVPIPLGQNRGAVAMEYINSCALVKFSKLVLENGAAEVLYNQGKYLLIKMAELGLVHGDFNEFNLLVEVTGFDALHGLINEQNEESTDNSEDNIDEEEYDNSETEEDITEEETEDDELSEDNENADCPYLEQDVNTFKLRMIDFPQVISRDNKAAQEIYERDRNGLVSFFMKFMKIDEDNLPPLFIEDIVRTDYLDYKLRAPGYPRNVDKNCLNSVEDDKCSDEESIDNDDDEECQSVKTTSVRRAITVDAIKKRVIKEQSKNVKKERICKQQRNIMKKEIRRDLQADLF